MKKIVSIVIVALAFVLATYIATQAFKDRNGYLETIQVTGLGKKDFTSDLIVWSATFSKKDYSLSNAYTLLKKDQEIIRNYLTSKGVLAEEIVFSATSIHKDFNYRYDANGNSTSTFTGYRLTQSVEIESKAIEAIEVVSREITELINNGVELYSNTPQYYYTKLSELKIEMIAAATEDARLRAEKIAAHAKAQLGDLKQARMGIFQIIGQNSNEDFSWGGTFNTTSKMKTATITMKLQFGIK